MFLGDVLIYLFEQFKNNTINYCILRNYENLPDDLGSNDIDIIIARGQKNLNHKIMLEMANRLGLVIYNNYQDERICQYFFYKKNGSELFFLKIDFFFQSELYGCCYLTGQQILGNKKRYKNFYIADEIDGFLDKAIYLYLLNAEIAEPYLIKARKFYKNRFSELETKTKFILGKHNYKAFLKTLSDTTFIPQKITLFLRIRILLRLAMKSPIEHLLKIPIYLFFRFKYRVIPHGELISLSGPDGCGKTTLLNIVGQHLSRAFRFDQKNIYHHRPSLFPRIATIIKKANLIEKIDEEYSKPHRGKPSGLLGSSIRLCYYLADYVLGYFIKIRSSLVRREVVVFDRYYYDMVADCERSNISLPQKFLIFFLKIIPTPTSAFYISVSKKTILERKQELTPEAIARLSARYQSLVKNRPEFIAVDNETDIEKAANCIIHSLIMKRANKIKS